MESVQFYSALVGEEITAGLVLSLTRESCTFL